MRNMCDVWPAYDKLPLAQVPHRKSLPALRRTKMVRTRYEQGLENRPHIKLKIHLQQCRKSNTDLFCKRSQYVVGALGFAVIEYLLDVRRFLSAVVYISHHGVFNAFHIHTLSWRFRYICFAYRADHPALRDNGTATYTVIIHFSHISG